MTRLRFRLAQRAERGYIMFMTLGILILLAASSLLVVGATKAQVVTARENERFTNSRQAMEEAMSTATYELNKNSTQRAKIFAGQPASGSSSTAVGGRGAGVRGVSNWVYDPVNRLILTEGVYDGTVETRSAPLRGANVEKSETLPDGGFAYHVTANGPSNTGIWANTLAASGGDSTVKGNFTGKPTVAAYGTAKVSVSANAGSTLSTVEYGSDSSVSGVSSAALLGKGRSLLTATFDTVRLKERTDEVTIVKCASTPASSVLTGSAYGCNSGDFSLPNTTIAGSGVKTLVVRGNLTIPYDLTYNNGQLHIYASGNVNITRGALASTTRTLRNVFIYAPSGECKAADGVSVSLSGSMACQKLSLPSNTNTFNRVIPSGDATSGTAAIGNAAVANDVIFYTERDGYVDSLTN